MREKLIKACTHHESLEIIYMAKDGQFSKRIIDVLQIGTLTVRTYCHSRQSTRIFSIENILAFSPIYTKVKRVI